MLTRDSDLVASATWISCIAAQQEAEAFAEAANQWVEARTDVPLSECPFEEHIPKQAIIVDFEAAESEGGHWCVYVYCAWTLNDYSSVAEAAHEAEQYFDEQGISCTALESLIFGDSYGADSLDDGRPLFVFNPELCIYDYDTNPDATVYLLVGAQGAIVLEKLA